MTFFTILSDSPTVIVIVIVAIIIFLVIYSDFRKFALEGIKNLLEIGVKGFLILAVIMIFLGVSSLFIDTKESIGKKKFNDFKEEVTTEKTGISFSDIPENDTVVSHHRVWFDYKNEVFRGDLEISKSDWHLCSNNRDRLRFGPFDENTWGKLYLKLIQFDHDKLERIYEMFKKLRVENNLSDTKFAEAIVTCVQDIDYTLVLPRKCDPDLYDDEFIKTYLEDCNSCCLGNIRYGVQSPIEFMGNLKGDCDTRTVLLYTILSKFEFDVIVLGSSQYRHSMIGINIPYYGKYKLHKGKKYYVWETTGFGLEPGLISPRMSDMSLWFVNLPSINNK